MSLKFDVPEIVSFVYNLTKPTKNNVEEIFCKIDDLFVGISLNA